MALIKSTFFPTLLIFKDLSQLFFTPTNSIVFIALKMPANQQPRIVETFSPSQKPCHSLFKSFLLFQSVFSRPLFSVSGLLFPVLLAPVSCFPLSFFLFPVSGLLFSNSFPNQLYKISIRTSKSLRFYSL